MNTITAAATAGLVLAVAAIPAVASAATTQAAPNNLETIHINASTVASGNLKDVPTTIVLAVGPNGHVSVESATFANGSVWSNPAPAVNNNDDGAGLLGVSYPSEAF